MLNYDEHQELQRRLSAFLDGDRQRRCLQYSERWVVAGKTTPWMREPELALLGTLDDRQLELYVALKAVQPVVVEQ